MEFLHENTAVHTWDNVMESETTTVIQRPGVFQVCAQTTMTCGTETLTLKQTFTQYPAIHTNYSLSNCTTLNKKDFNRYSDFLVIN